MLFASRKEEAPPVAPWDEEPFPPRRPLPLPLRHLLGFSAGGSVVLIICNFIYFLLVADHPSPQGPDPADILILGTLISPVVAAFAGGAFTGTIALLRRKCFTAEPPRRFRTALAHGIAFGLLLWCFPGMLTFLLIPPAFAAAASFIRLRSFLPYRPIPPPPRPESKNDGP
ncbi:MAG: hypothetical protein JXP34_16740 [Planctomycetes bacterium]|nr:hypothetical protein [Planctomycetota bacterium]